jgi:hypothetical protein
MVLLDAVLLLGVVGLAVYVFSGLARGLSGRRELPGSRGHWQVAHFAKAGYTQVVVRKVGADGRSVVDEHLIAAVAEQDPDYDATFLEAMAQARQRAALYESEES